MDIPIGLDGNQANQLVFDCDAAFLNGHARTNRQSIAKCSKCGVRFQSKSYNFCPICAMRNAKKIELRNAPMDFSHVAPMEPTWREKLSYYIDRACMVGFIVACATAILALVVHILWAII